MKSTDQWKQIATGLSAGLHEGSLSIPWLLIKFYHKMNLTETETMLLVHLMAYIEKEKNDFPTPEDIASRMTIDAEAVVAVLEKLLKEQFITIDEAVEPVSNVRFERYNLSPLYDKLAQCRIEEWKESDEEEEESADQQADPFITPAEMDIFTLFEGEFARPLTPMEMETITIWLDREGYKQELILAALKEAVFAGKVHFRYIDRILLDWSRNRVFTVEQAKEYTHKFRGAR